MNRVAVTVEPEGRRINVKINSSLLDVLTTSDVTIRSECSGKGVCGKCKVLIKKQKRFNNLTEPEMNLLTSEEIELGYRLACQV